MSTLIAQVDAYRLQLIRAAVERSSGNVRAAARELGISEGVIRHHLRRQRSVEAPAAAQSTTRIA